MIKRCKMYGWLFTWDLEHWVACWTWTWIGWKYGRNFGCYIAMVRGGRDSIRSGRCLDGIMLYTWSNTILFSSPSYSALLWSDFLNSAVSLALRSFCQRSFPGIQSIALYQHIKAFVCILAPNNYHSYRGINSLFHSNFQPSFWHSPQQHIVVYTTQNRKGSIFKIFVLK